VHCMLDNEGYKHTLIICNTYCFSTATMVAWTTSILRYMYIACVVGISCYVCLLYFLRNNSRNIMVQHQEFQMTDTVKSHFEEKCIQSKYLYLVCMDNFIETRRN
jgi:hypothetical protein